MAITSMDGIVTGLQTPQSIVKAAFTGQGAGQYHSSFYLAGLPGAGTAPSPGIAGAALTSFPGQIPFPAAVSSQNIYLGGWDVEQGGNIGSILLVDRLWHNSGIASATTTAQTVNSVAFPARDTLGTVNGNGLIVGLEVSTATTNGSPITNTTLSYTDSAGNSGNTATIASFPANAVVGTFVPFALAAGDTGIKSIQSITLGTSYGTGVVDLVVMRVLSVIGSPVANTSNRLDAIQCGFPVLYANTCPQLLYVLTGTAGGIVVANVSYAQG